MDRFIAMIWEEASALQSGQAQVWTDALRARSSWTVILDKPGLRLFSKLHRTERPIATSFDRLPGAVVGTLFERGREEGGRKRSLCAGASERILAGRGGHLVENFWGNYVALWRDPVSNAVTLLRDPCGAVPCFLTRAAGVDLAFSYAADVASLPGIGFSIDREFLKAFLLFSYFSTHQTGLESVTELLPGQRVVFQPGKTPAFSWAWNAATISAVPTHRSFEEARLDLRGIAETCFAAWGNEYGRIAVQLSGGLDSSIALALLRRYSAASVTALHFVGEGYESFERGLARAAADRAGVRLVELPPDAAVTDLGPMLFEPPLVRPTPQVFGLAADAIAELACDEAGAAAMVAGHGGDSLFLQRSVTGAMLEDHVRLNGLRRDFWRVAYDSATLQQRPVWELVASAAASAFRRPRWTPYEFLSSALASGRVALTPEAAASVPEAYMVHPWLAEAAQLPRGKAEQLRAIVALYRYYAVRGHGVTRDALNPWVSQPIVEFALRTPTFVFGSGGVDRSLQRRAFADLIPEDIARRTGKGFIDHHMLVVIRRNLDLLRTLVLDGALMKEDWFDRPRIEKMFTSEALSAGASTQIIQSLVAVEVWLRSWR